MTASSSVPQQWMLVLKDPARLTFPARDKPTPSDLGSLQEAYLSYVSVVLLNLKMTAQIEFLLPL